MSDLSTATREIMWNIPSSFKVAMYTLMVVSLAVFCIGLVKKLKFVTLGGPLKGLLDKENGLFRNLQWGQFLKTIFLTGKVPRAKEVKIFHGFIFFGFFILWIATDIVAIHYDTPFKIFEGPLYVVVSFLADFAGLFLLIGLAMAFHRRYVKKPDYLSATNPGQEKYLYGMLANLVIIGFVIEGVRILGTGMPVGEKTWAPIGYSLAVLFQLFGLSDSGWALIYRGLWLFHMVSTFVFIASIPFTKFYHIVGIPLASLITPRRRAAVLDVMDFEDETAETFGLGKVEELTQKNRLDLLACVECGRCTQACPANRSGKDLDPKLIVTKMRDFCLAPGEDLAQREFWGENQLYKSNELDACTTCGACMEECPAHIEHLGFILEAKRYKVLTLGDIPAAAGDATNNVRVNGNPWGIAQDDRFKWADGLDIPVIEAGKKVDYLYYVGCAGSYDAANQKVVQDTMKLLKAANVNFAVMGKTEKCNGDPIRRFGDEYSFFEIAIENIANINQYDFDKIVTHCPHCLHTLGKEYAKLEDGKYDVVHHTELLDDLIKSKKLTPKKSVDETVTFHDPCYLGRHHGNYSSPRNILDSIPGLNIKEMEESKDRSLCCGMGGGNMWYELPEGENLAVNRLKHVSETKTEQLATACSYCLINFNSSLGQVKEVEDLKINDVASFLAKSVETNEG